MAEVRIAHFSGEAVTLPPVCMRCGGTADVRRVRRFHRIPKQAQVLFFTPYNFVFVGIVYLLFGRKVRMSAPLCRRHRNHWRIRNSVIWGGLPAAAAATALFEALAAIGLLPTSMRGAGPLVFIAILLLWIVGLVICDVTAMRSLHIDDEGIVLTGVSSDFVRALGDQQLCVKCGYDLKGNVSGVCPECGTRAPTQRPAPMAGGGRA